MQSKPLLVGITGGIGAGKTTVCKVLEVLGHKVYYADDRAKWLMTHSENLKAKIKGLFGDDAYLEGALNRKRISALVFEDASLLKKLNAYVHPAVAEDLKKWVRTHPQETFLFDEAALMYETGSYKKMDATILVTAPEEVRIKRVLSRDSHRSAESVQAIIANQMSDADKLTLADFVIKNDEKISVIGQTMEVYDLLLNRHK